MALSREGKGHWGSRMSLCGFRLQHEGADDASDDQDGANDETGDAGFVVAGGELEIRTQADADDPNDSNDIGNNLHAGCSSSSLRRYLFWQIRTCLFYQTKRGL